MLPFDAEVFFVMLGQYADAFVWAQVVAYALAIVGLVLAFVPGPWTGVVVAGILALFWLWTGIVFHLRFLWPLSFFAPVLGTLAVVQALLLAWNGVIRRRLSFQFTGATADWTGLAVVGLAAAFFPGLARLAAPTEAAPVALPPLVGLAPEATLLFTLGMFLLLEGRVRFHLLVIPVMLALLSGWAALVLRVPEGLAVAAGALLALGVAIAKPRTSPRPE